MLLKWRGAIKSFFLKKTKVIVSGSIEEILDSKAVPCVTCSKRLMANSVLCPKCGKWVHGRCAKMKRVTSTLAKDFICERSVKAIKKVVEPAEELTSDDQGSKCRVFVFWETD